MPPSNFGPYSSAFETGELPVPAYLFLLNLSEPGVELAIDRIQVALKNTTRPPTSAVLAEVCLDPL